MSGILKKGMYVRCTVKCENTPVYLYGQIEKISSDFSKVSVRLHDLTHMGLYAKMYSSAIEVDYEAVKHIPARLDAKVEYGGIKARFVPSSENSLNEDSMFEYFIECYKDGKYHSERVREDQIKVHMTHGYTSPLELFSAGKVYHSKWYLYHSLISEAQSMLRIAPDGFKSILGSRAMLFPHQIDTINRALSGDNCRFMLADEVGLGKTIEACSILKGLKARNRRLRTLIIVPDPLRPQWIDELHCRFMEKAVAMVSGMSTANLEKHDIVVTTFDILDKPDAIISASSVRWDLCIIDEAHKLLCRPSLYRKVLELSNKTEKVLVLSATPVLKESIEYHQLLSLINPNRFAAMPHEQFSNLVAKQAKIRDIIHDMERDLSDYVGYNLKNDFLYMFEEVHSIVCDYTLAALIQKIANEENPETSVLYVKDALAYISEQYQVDKNIIRHRKAELTDSFVTRELVDIPYEPAGAAEGFFENECIQSVTDLFTYVLSGASNSKIVDMCKKLLQATTSSPYAVLGIVINQSSANNPIVDNYISTVNAWKQAYDWEITNIQDLRCNPERFHSKLSKILHWIETEDSNAEKKFLIFSEYPHTAVQYFNAFSSYFGKDSSLLFRSGLKGIEYNQIIHDFQNRNECRFLICDASGGVGRNFQMADYIVHCDLSWSPAIMEQRIGRLDRIGRNPGKKVTSVVVHSDYGTENDLFRIYNESLGVFTKSLCGMEIAFDQMQDAIDKAFVQDPAHGLQYILPTLSEFANQIELEVEQEMYYAQTRQLDNSAALQIEKLMKVFALNNTTALSSALCAWAKAIGISNLTQTKSFYDKVDTVIMDLGELDKTKQYKYTYVLPFSPTHPVILGSFNREAVVAHEHLYFLAPSNSLYDSIAKNALERHQGLSSLINISNTGVKWEGFTFCWNIYYDYARIMEKGLPSDTLSVLTKYLSSAQIRVFVSMPSLSVDDNDELFRVFSSFVIPENSHNVQSLDMTKLENKSDYILDVDWDMCVNGAYSKALETAKEKYQLLLNKQEAESYLEGRLTELKAKGNDSFAYKVCAKLSSKAYKELFMSGIENSIFELDSAAYLIVE